MISTCESKDFPIISVLSSKLRFSIILIATNAGLLSELLCYILLRMKLDARDALVLTVVMFKERPWQHVDSAYLGSRGSFLIAQHFKVVLEHINQFIGLQRFFYPVGDSVNEFIKLF